MRRNKIEKESDSYMLLCDYLRVKKYAKQMSDTELDISLDLKVDDLLFVYNQDKYYVRRLNRTYVKVNDDWVKQMRKRVDRYAKMFNILREERITKIATTRTIRGHKHKIIE